MSVSKKLLLIAALAPLGFLLAFFTALGKPMGIVFYPFVLAPTLLLVFLLHDVFQRWRLGRGIQALVVIVGGMVGAFVVTLFVFMPNLADITKLPALFMNETGEMLYFFGYWTSWGVGTGLVAWSLYNFGPLKVTPPVDQTLTSAETQS